MRCVNRQTRRVVHLNIPWNADLTPEERELIAWLYIVDHEGRRPTARYDLTEYTVKGKTRRAPLPTRYYPDLHFDPPESLVPKGPCLAIRHGYAVIAVYCALGAPPTELDRLRRRLQEYVNENPGAQIYEGPLPRTLNGRPGTVYVWADDKSWRTVN